MIDRVSAKKSLGQCFLVERSFAARIAAALNLQENETVLEIGPGRGILTTELLNSGALTIAVEIDRRLLDPLQEKFGDNPNFSLHHEDFLDTDLASQLPHGSCKLAGNLPYHLVAEVVFKLLDYTRQARGNPMLPWIECAVFMMQKEVAERVVAQPGTKTYSRISVFTQLEADAYSLFTVPAGAFRPAPKVDGGVVRIDFLRVPESIPRDFAVLERIVRFTFHQRRKMLKSSLSSMPGIHPFWQQADIDFTRRPETLSPSEWVRLADAIVQARDRA
ncbi:MAG: 16S rRNA (adenine(1518)-N(6)/adenine(1519)-N(6))-dimethyltransferase RsmA [Calditrichota bacterium]